MDEKMKYRKFFLMILTSVIIMYGLMYLNTYAWGHLRFSETRLYMDFIMGSAMAIIMLSFMKSMYQNLSLNRTIYFASIAVFAVSVWLVRSQVTVEDNSYMRAMIPHHSIAIMTSTRANIKDVRVRKLAESINEAQRREIDEMTWLIDDINKNGLAISDDEALKRPVPNMEKK